jgi:hypothetical protein
MQRGISRLFELLSESANGRGARPLVALEVDVDITATETN